MPESDQSVQKEEDGQGAPAWVPTIILHIFYPTSRKVGFGWTLFIVSSWAAFFGKNSATGAPLLDASNWLLCSSMTSLLIGGGTIMDARNAIEKAKLDAGASSGSLPS